MNSNEMITEQQLAEILRIGISTIRRWRSTGMGPTHIRMGSGRGSIRYRMEDVDDFIEKNSRSKANQLEG
jgi:predicted DNA-binding transcriptional regulator AlpA